MHADTITHLEERKHATRLHLRDILLRRHLPPQLPQNRQRALEQIQIRVQLPPNPLQQQNRNDRFVFEFNCTILSKGYQQSKKKKIIISLTD